MTDVERIKKLKATLDRLCPDDQESWDDPEEVLEEIIEIKWVVNWAAEHADVVRYANAKAEDE